ncbi:MAG: fatty acid CoA ligase family protein [Phycisphaerae bacterium]|nr:fatty acid CoA ligase family protein [Phycisphaerae bacterium]
MPETTVNIASHLPDLAARQPDTPAVIACQGRNVDGTIAATIWTYRQLNDQSDVIARGLGAFGIERGRRTVLLVPPGLDFFALVFALYKVGAVMVCVDPGIGVRNLKKCLDEAEPEAFIGNPKAHLARMLLGWGRRTNRINVTVPAGDRRPVRRGQTCNLSWIRQLGGEQGPPALAETRETDPAAILFTSGSTGTPKGAIYSHGNFCAQVQALKAAYDIAPGEIDLATFPLFGLFAPALGMTAVVPEMDFTRPGRADPAHILQAITQFQVTTMFGSPALLDRLGRHAASGPPRKLPTLRRVISAGAPVPAKVLANISDLLQPPAQVHTPYGATEALPVCSIGSKELLAETVSRTDEGRGVCVGRPVGDMEVRVIQVRDDAIERWSDDLLQPPETVGEVAVRGPVVTAAYHNRPAATARAKIPAEDGSFYHRMGDLAYFDASGRLWFCGRKSQRVKLADGDLYTVCCEGIFNAHPSVYRSALVGVPRRGQTLPAICVELEEADRNIDRDQLTQDLLHRAQAHDHTRVIKHILFSRRFPVDIRHNAKIGRERLARWAAGRLP